MYYVVKTSIISLEEDAVYWSVNWLYLFRYHITTPLANHSGVDVMRDNTFFRLIIDDEINTL
jgi:hypothetical protein